MIKTKRFFQIINSFVWNLATLYFIFIIGISLIYLPDWNQKYKVMPEGASSYESANSFIEDPLKDLPELKEDDPKAVFILKMYKILNMLIPLMILAFFVEFTIKNKSKVEKFLYSIEGFNRGKYIQERNKIEYLFKRFRRWIQWN